MSNTNKNDQQNLPNLKDANDQLQKELDALKGELNAVKSENEELTSELEELKKSLADSDASGVISPPVPGVFKASFENPDGKKVNKKVRFKNGRKEVVLHPTGKKVSSACVMKVANGKTLTEDELNANPDLRGFGKAEAVALLTHYVSIGAGFLEDA